MYDAPAHQQAHSHHTIVHHKPQSHSTTIAHRLTDSHGTSYSLETEAPTKEPTDKGTLCTCKIRRVIKSGVKKQDLFKSEKSPNFIGRDAIQVKSRLSAKTKARCRQWCIHQPQ